ncbi:Ran GTPase-activating protein 1 [Lamellibrachia satsuma]|nr:Ran GTPase-activating protein 1 [Lamellibrachia satsuma]
MDKVDQLGSFSKDDPVSSDSEEEGDDTSVQVNAESTQKSPQEKGEEEGSENGQGDEKEKGPPHNTSDISSLTDQLAKTTVEEKVELNFTGCGFKLDTEADAEKITQKIDSCPNLNALRLEGNTLGVEAAKAIGESLTKHPEFERALWSDMFTGRLKSEIPGALQHLGSGIMSAQATLTELDLSDNAFGPNGMVGLTDLLKSSSCYRLQALKLNNNGLGIHGGKMLADCLLECHRRGCQAGTPLQLRVFVSGRGRLENDGAKALAEAFKVMGSLEEVSMPQNGINPKGIAALADAFAQNPNLRVINMNDNTFTVAGARSMAEALPHLSRLEEVNFGDCLVRNAGAEVLAEALTNGHQSLKRLILSFNEVKESGANAIAYAMTEKPDLEKLDLDGNQLGEDGIRVVRATMESVDKLDLLGSFSDDEGLDSEEEEDDEEEEEEEEDDERENSHDSEAVNEVRSQVKDVTLTPHQDKTVTTKDFLLFPSPSKLKAMGSHRVDDIVSYLQEDSTDVDRAMHVFMKVSCIVVPDDEQTSKAACECADAIFCTLFQSTENSQLAGAVANSILVHLGLIKSEDKKFRPVSHPDGVLRVLEHAVRQDYFLKGVRDILHVFITRPHPALIECHRSRQNLLNTLSKWQ